MPASLPPRSPLCTCAAALVLVVTACGGGQEVAPPPAPPAQVATAAQPSPPAEAPESEPPAPCPADMAYVDATYCPRVEQKCLHEEYNKPNKIIICHKFAETRRCVGEPRRQQFCIDRYEYPNEEGAHPPVMVDWYDAESACESRGKRLCWESEWVSACEGPDRTPFPYGLSRDPKKCNIDNPYIEPVLEKFYSRKAVIAGPELLRLDQSVASGAMPGCVSGFGVHDMTGNLDEWVNAEHPKGKAQWAGLKGGAWGHVRNACRPMTTSHPPEFTYYFISFRCCADAVTARDDASVWTPPPPPRKVDPKGTPSLGWTPKR